MNKYCIGWIPHLNGAPFIINRWKQRIAGKKEDGEKLYFQYTSTHLKSLNHLFNFDRIIQYYGLPDSSTIETEIRASPFIAQCRPVDDIDATERWFFVYLFEDDTLSCLKTAYIFKSTWENPIGSTNINLLYLATVKVTDIKPEGFITLELIQIAKGTEVSQDPNYASTDQYLIETFQAIRDILHDHTHHINPCSHPYPEVPDSIIRPVITTQTLCKEVMLEISESYQVSMLEHLEHIVDLVNNAEAKKIWFSKPYSELVSILKQANGILIYFNQYLLELFKLEKIDETTYKSMKESALNMEDAYQSFYETLDSRFQMSITVRSELLLVVTTLLTFWLVYLECVPGDGVDLITRITLPIIVTSFLLIYYFYNLIIK